MPRRLIVTMHWSDAGLEADIEATTAAMQPLKAEGTSGWAGAYEEKVGQEIWDIMTVQTDDPDDLPFEEAREA